MRKTTSKSTKTTTGKRAAKAAPKNTEKAPASAPAQKPVEAPKVEEKATKAKHEAIKSGGTIQINEAVGVHFRADAETAPIEGDMVMVVVGADEVPLIVSCTKPLVDGSTLIQAFVTKKSGDYKILGEAKGETATVIWK